MTLTNHTTALGKTTLLTTFACLSICHPQIFMNPASPEERVELMTDFGKECRIMSMIRHPNIVQFYGSIQEAPNFCIISELCEGNVVDVSARQIHRRPSSIIRSNQTTSISHTHTLSICLPTFPPPQLLNLLSGRKINVTWRASPLGHR